MLHVNTSVDTDSDIEGALWTQHKLVDKMFLKKLLCYDLPNISNAFSYLIQHLQNFFFWWMFGNWKLFSSYLFIFSPLSCIVEVCVVHYHPSLSISSNAPKKVRNVGHVINNPGTFSLKHCSTAPLEVKNSTGYL